LIECSWTIINVAAGDTFCNTYLDKETNIRIRSLVQNLGFLIRIFIFIFLLPISPRD